MYNKMRAYKQEYDDKYNKHASKNARDMQGVETPGLPKKNHRNLIFHYMQYFLYYFGLIVICPLLIYCGLKLLVFKKILGVTDLNADIGSAVGLVIALHVAVLGYIITLFVCQESPRTEKKYPFLEWDTKGTLEHGTIYIILMLTCYCSLILFFPLFTFAALKYIVLENLLLVAEMNANIISTIGTILAIHTALAVYIYKMQVPEVPHALKI